MLTTTGQKLERLSQGDFVDVVYSYAVNSPEMRHDFRTAITNYMFDLKPPVEEDNSFEGFAKQSMSMLDELDAFKLG